MHIVLINQHHHNYDCAATGRHYTFLKHLAKRHKITLITSDAWRKQQLSQHYPWVPEGVELVEVKVPYANKMNVRQRLFSYTGFAWHALVEGLRVPKPDVIWGVSTPLTTPWVAAKVAGLRRVPWVFEVQDLWPSFPIEMGAVPQKWLQHLLYKEEKKLYRQAEHIITLSADMTEYVVNTGTPASKVTTLVNGTDFDLIEQTEGADLQQLRQKYKIGDRKVVLYAGTYGRANDIPSILEAAKQLQAQQEVCFVFTGGGFFADEIRQAAKEQQNIVMLEEPLPRHQVFNLYRLAALSLVTFIDLPVLATNSPAKFYDSLAVGTPVLVTNPGWTKKFVEEHNCGWYVPATQPQLLADKIKVLLAEPEQLKAAGSRGAAAAKKYFDREDLSRQLEQILEQAATP